MPYLVRLKNPSGHKVGEFGPFPSQAAAKKQAQVFADQAAPGVSVYVEKAAAPKKNPSKKPGLRERMRRVGERGFTVVEGIEKRLGRVGGQYVGLSDDETDRAVAEMQAARRELAGVKAAAKRRAKRNPSAEEHFRAGQKMTHMIEAAVALGDVAGMQFYRGAQAAHYGDPRVNPKKRAVDRYLSPKLRFVKQADAAELVNLFHLARTALGSRATRHARLVWAADAFAKEHPYVTSTGAYKDLGELLR